MEACTAYMRPARCMTFPRRVDLFSWQEYGHRVRLASHSVYREFITGFGLEFFPLGGDPKVNHSPGMRNSQHTRRAIMSWHQLLKTETGPHKYMDL